MSQFPLNPSSFSTPPTLGGPMSGAPAKTSVLAILSLVMGILGICTGLPAIAGVVLGIIAMVKINRSQGRLSGNGLAITGTCISTAAMLFSCFSLALLLPALAKARSEAMNLKQQVSMKQLGAACINYATANSDQFPPVDHWEEVLSKDLGDIAPLIATPFDPGVRRAVAMNAKLRGKSLDEVTRPDRTVMMFEVQAGSPQAGGEELLPAKPRSHSGYSILFVDGHSEFIKPEHLRTIVWEP